MESDKELGSTKKGRKEGDGKKKEKGRKEREGRKDKEGRKEATKKEREIVWGIYRPLHSPLVLFEHCADLPPGAPFLLYTEACAGRPGHFELMLASGTVSDASSVSATLAPCCHTSQ